ncbi:MAG: hypothetical protein LBP34_07095 [Flavobacteriaceae bacterium]|jgi:membrane-anchored glycerophosphoryl diester phosphodiesterase (GDPDase)|nr:hypothetical protein [Flavobacteriaceae bacterium]
MDPQQKIEFLKTRTVSNTITDTINFIRTNGKSLLGGLFGICIPILLLSGVFAFLFFTNYFDFIFTTLLEQNEYMVSETERIGETILYLFLFLLSTFLTMSLVSTASYVYVKLYRNEEKITTKTLWDASKKYLGKVIGAQILFFGSLVVVYVICLIPIFIGGDIAFLTLLLLPLSFVGIFYFSMKLTFFQAFIVLEDSGIMESFKQSYHFTRGIFWKTVLFMLLIGFVAQFFTYLFQLPGVILIYFQLIMGFTQGDYLDSSFSWTLGGALIGVGSAVGYVLYSIIFIGICFLYYSTIESRQGIRAKNEIDSIGENNGIEENGNLQ